MEVSSSKNPGDQRSIDKDPFSYYSFACFAPFSYEHFAPFSKTTLARFAMASDEIVPNHYNVIYKSHVDASGATSLSDRIKDHCSGRTTTRQVSASEPHITEGVRHCLNIPGLRGCSGTFDIETLATLKADKDVGLEKNFQTHWLSKTSIY